MAGFQRLHLSDATLSKGNMEATPQSNDKGLVFSQRPLQEGEGFTVEVIDKGKSSHPNLVVGVTSRLDWNAHVTPWNTSDTWCLFTWTGDVYVNGSFTNACPYWRQTFGGDHKMAEGDVITMTLSEGRVTVTYNDAVFDDVFTYLPQGELWAVVHFTVDRVRAVTADAYGDVTDSSDDSDLESDLVDHLSHVTVSARSRHRTPASIPCQAVQWELYSPHSATEVKVKASDVKVKPSKAEFYQKLTEKAILGKMKVYSMFRARKGRVCIISLPRCEVDWLPPLEGYRTDELRLSQLWDQMGFDVYTPRVEGRGLTSEEIQKSVTEFASMFAKSDQMAVLCILSHGGRGFVYGADGGKVDISGLAHCLDNRNCKVMADKPKLILVQACQGGDTDEGVHVETESYAAAAASVSESHLPAISDMVVCYPAMPGFISFVHVKEGSVFVKIVVDVFSSGSYKKEISTLMLEINDKVSETAVQYQKDANSAMTEQKQMANYHSCLRKNLYFLPCPNGKQGKNWM